MNNVIDLVEIMRCKDYDELNKFLDEIDEILKEINDELDDIVED